MKTFVGNARVLSLSEWETPASHYEERRVGRYRLHKGKYTEGLYRHNAVDGYLWTQVEGEIPLMYLQELRNGKWCDWMLDDPKDFSYMQKYAEAAEGDVLTTGLGLGLLLHELAKNPKVTSVTVVERSPEVCDLVSGYVPSCNLVMQDFYNFIENDNSHWDMIVVDIWSFTKLAVQKQLFLDEAFPLYEYLREKYPGAKLVFHGFDPISDVKAAKPFRECHTC